MKKTILLCLMVIIVAAMCACDSEPSRFAYYDDEEIYELGYEEGYKAGAEYAIEYLLENADGYTQYMDVEDIEDSMRDYYGDEAEEMRDLVVYNPDYERYSFKELLEELINN